MPLGGLLMAVIMHANSAYASFTHCFFSSNPSSSMVHTKQAAVLLNAVIGEWCYVPCTK